MIGELLLRPDLGRKAYRLRCRFAIDAAPPASLTWYRRAWQEELERQKVRVAEMFVEDLAKQGFEYLDAHGVTMTGPYPVTPEPVRLTLPPRLTSAQMLPAVIQGARFLPDPHEAMASFAEPLDATERWEFELSAVFVHKTIKFEYADSPEEEARR